MQNRSRLDPDLVHDFVNDAHSNLDRVRDLLGRHATVVNAAWDWGGGDWETGLGAAAHMGRKDIALLLLEHGARMDIFAAAMLGHLEIVEGDDPGAPRSAAVARAARDRLAQPRRGRRSGGLAGCRLSARARRDRVAPVSYWGRAPSTPAASDAAWCSAAPPD